jgi:NAD(P)-dependent dehydrogenase (short-subunit alcohol dehydrogenase family)
MGVLAGRVAVVTGASRGIGEYVARRFAAEGAAVAVVARTQEQTDERLPGTIHQTVATIRAAGGTAIPIRADLSKPADRARIIDEAERELGPVDILVNNAAVTFFLPVADFPGRRYDLMFEVQVKAPFELSQRVLPGMRERGQGWILNISSMAAVHPAIPPEPGAGIGGTVYGMCKAALERLTTGLAAEVYADGVAVNVLSPTRGVPTPGVLFHNLITDVDQALASGDAESPEMFAEASLALCSGDPAVLTGRVAYSRQLVAELGRAPGPLDGPAA